MSGKSCKAKLIVAALLLASTLDVTRVSPVLETKSIVTPFVIVWAFAPLPSISKETTGDAPEAAVNNLPCLSTVTVAFV